MEKRLKDYIDENVEDLKNQLDQLHDRFVTDLANNKVTMRFLSQSITNTEKGINERFIEMLGNVGQHLQKIQKEMNQDFETFIAEKLNPSKKRRARAAFGACNDSQKPSDTQESSTRICSGTQRSETNLVSHQRKHDSSLVQLEKLFGIQLGNVQTYLESVVCEMKSGTYKRLALLDFRVGVIEEKMDKIIFFMEKLEANAESRSF